LPAIDASVARGARSGSGTVAIMFGRGAARRATASLLVTSATRCSASTIRPLTTFNRTASCAGTTPFGVRRSITVMSPIWPASGSGT